MPSYPHLLFDLDGTLIDSVGLILDSYRHTAAVHGLPQRDEAEWLRGLGTPLRSQFAPYAETPEHMEALIATYREYNLANHDARVTPYPGIVDVVRTLHGRGARLGIVTSKNRQGTLRGLRLVGLDDVFEVLVCADDVVNPKPHPEPVEKAVALLGAALEHTVFIGDSPHDMHSGKRAGVRTAAVLWGPFGREDLEPCAPDHFVQAPEELLALG
ncbi:MAG: HAD-IA family hydrolase [Gemmatimonadota bacterium]